MSLLWTAPALPKCRSAAGPELQRCSVVVARVLRAAAPTFLQAYQLLEVVPGLEVQMAVSAVVRVRLPLLRGRSPAEGSYAVAGQ